LESLPLIEMTMVSPSTIRTTLAVWVGPVGWLGPAVFAASPVGATVAHGVAAEPEAAATGRPVVGDFVASADGEGEQAARATANAATVASNFGRRTLTSPIVRLGQAGVSSA
jgi:hypothetical protein